MTLMTTSQTTELACRTRDTAAACVDVLREIVAGLDPDVLLPTEVPEVWALFDEGEKLCSAAKTLVAHRVDESGVWKEAGMRSAAEYLALRGGTTRDAARESLKTSERLGNLPHVGDVLRRGELSAAQAHVIADAAALDPAAQKPLLDHAKVASFKELKDECLRRKAAAEPDPNKKRERIHKDRFFRLSTDTEGAWRLSGRGPLDHAGAFGATLNPLIDEEFKRARDEGRREERDKLAYDALQEMARLARAMYYGDGYYDEDDGTETGADQPDEASVEDTGTSQTTRHSRHTDDRPRTRDRPNATERHEPTSPDEAGAGQTGSTTGDPGNTAVAGDPAGPSSAEGDPASRPPEEDGLGDQQPVEGVRGGSYPAGGVQPPLPGHNDPSAEAGAGAGAAPNGRQTGHTNKRPKRKNKNGTTKQKRKKRVNPSHLAILRLDVEALRRGYTHSDELCEVSGVGPIPVATAHELLGDAIVKLVLTKGTAVASVVHLGRGPTVAQRTALLWAQPECSVAGCPHTFTQVDHRHDWRLCKETALHNLDRLCSYHHGLKTHHSWALVPGTGKRPMVPPDHPHHPGSARGDVSRPAETDRDGHPARSAAPTEPTPTPVLRPARLAGVAPA